MSDEETNGANEIQSFADLLNEINEYNEESVKVISESIYKIDTNDDGICALKLFKVKNSDKDYPEYKKLFEKFIKQVMHMSAIKHTATASIISWNITSKFNKEWIKKYNKDENVDNLADDPKDDSNDENKKHYFHPFILMPLYNGSLQDKINNKEIEKWDLTQFVLFIYGCLRAFHHMNTFGLIFNKIEYNKILFEEVDGYQYPIINDFRQDDQAKLPNQLNSFGEILDYLTERNDSFKIKPIQKLINMLKSDKNQFIDFNTVSQKFEVEIIQNLLKNSKIDESKFKEYKDRIDKFESNNFASKQNAYSSAYLDKNLQECGGNIYKITRKIISFAKEANLQAALRASLLYYNGGILQKDLVNCIRLLNFAQSKKYPVPFFFLKSLKSIRDRFPSDEKSDEISLYYKGAFHESVALDLMMSGNDDDIDNDENNDDDENSSADLLARSMAVSAISTHKDKNPKTEIETAIDYYKKSLKVKKTPIVMGRLGALLTNYVNDKENAPGPRFLKLASDAKDKYGMINYGLYLIHHKKDNKEAIKVYESLYKMNYIDAAYILGNLYYAENDLIKAKEYFTQAYLTFGCDQAKQYIDKIESNNNNN